MTIHPFQTAKLNATPLARHLLPNATYGEITQALKAAVADNDYTQALALYDSREKLLQTMRAKSAGGLAEDAKRIKRRAAGMTDQTQEEVSEETILEVIASGKGMTAQDVADAISRKVSNTRVRLKSMEQRGQVKVTTVKDKQSNRWMRLYHSVANPAPPRANMRRASPVRDKVLAFIKANPGCNTPAIAAHMGCTVKAAAAHISEVRKVANVRSERAPGNGNHTPARHWIED